MNHRLARGDAGSSRTAILSQQQQQQQYPSLEVGSVMSVRQRSTGSADRSAAMGDGSCSGSDDENAHQALLADPDNDRHGQDHHLHEGSSSGGPLHVCTSMFWQRHAFFIGSILAVVGGIRDLSETMFEEQTAYNEDDGPTKLPLEYWDINKSLTVGSTLLYLIDSILHFVQQRREGRRHSATTTPSGVLVDYATRIRFAIIFGVASFFDLGASITDDEDYPWPSYIMDCLAVYLFWLSAVLLLYTKRSVYCDTSNCKDSPTSFWLLCSGDWLYWMGCTADVALNLLDSPWHDIGDIWVSTIGMVSALFWFFDAVIYELVDADIFDVVIPFGRIELDGGTIALVESGDSSGDEQE